MFKREKVCQLKLEQSSGLDSLDSATNRTLEAIVNQQDLSFVLGGTRLTLPSIYRDAEGMNLAEEERCLTKLPNAPQASFNSYERQHDSLCLDDTRVDILRDIMTWVDGQDERCIFWLNGMAGTGKSAIARTIARKYYSQ